MDRQRGGVRYRDEADGLVADHESALPIPRSVEFQRTDDAVAVGSTDTVTISLDRVRALHGRILHVRPTPALPDGAVNPELFWGQEGWDTNSGRYRHGRRHTELVDSFARLVVISGG